MWLAVNSIETPQYFVPEMRILDATLEAKATHGWQKSEWYA